MCVWNVDAYSLHTIVFNETETIAASTCQSQQNWNAQIKDLVNWKSIENETFFLRLDEYTNIFIVKKKKNWTKKKERKTKTYAWNWFYVE